MRTGKSELSRLRGIKNIAQAIEFLGLSVADFAALMPSQWATRKHISAQLVCDWKRGRRRPNRMQLDRVAQLIANKLTARYGLEIGVSLKVNSPWRAQAWIWCSTCRKYHELKNIHARRCARCAEK